ncbi:MAG: FAD-dependent oxidoreductase [Fibrobacter sp.]|nr:FAD-dependent oxidoreductase [Fibrobacter sp.]
MPPLRRPSIMQTMTLPVRHAPIIDRTDVLVVGAGPAGFGAAIAAADAGARVILAERFGVPGGNATVALVAPFCSYFTHSSFEEKSGAQSFFPTDHGVGVPVIAGVLGRLVRNLIASGGAITPSLETGYVVAYDHEICKQVMASMLDEAGVQFLYHAFASGVVPGTNEVSVIFESKSGPQVITASIVVDCTGDGDVAALAGAPFEVGREIDGHVQPMTVYFRMGHINKDEFFSYTRSNPSQWRGAHGLEDLIKKAKQSGELDIPRESILLFGTPRDDEVSVNGTRIIHVLGTDVFDLTFAEWKGRRQVAELARFLQKYVPGFRGAYLVQSGDIVSTRESRRIVGDYQLSLEDIFSEKKFKDVVALSTYPVDIHNPDGAGTMLYQLPPGSAYSIPLRCLFPKNLERILVAGRCISGTHEAHSSYRVMPVAMALGQAAGICAALAARSGTTIRGVPYRNVREELLGQGAILEI